MMGGFAAHRPQLPGAALRDRLVRLAVARMIRGRDEAGLTRRMLGARSARHVGEDHLGAEAPAERPAAGAPQ
jgi:hypothetical protein